LLLAEDCLPAQLIERQLWRKQTLKLDISAAISDPTRTIPFKLQLDGINSGILMKIICAP
jgi:hypothetical protein